MPQHYPRPSPARRIGLGLIQALGLGVGLMALTWFIAGHCLGPSSGVLTFALFTAAFAPLTLTTTWRGPRDASRPMKFAAFGLFFVSLIALPLTGPDTMCITAPSAVLSAFYVAIAGALLWAALMFLGPKAAASAKSS